MTPARFQEITSHYPRLRVAVIGDFCLDRYLEIDPSRQEVSIETGLPVHNVTRVRAQPGGAGTILNNLAALGIGTIFPVGFAGEDGEGYELKRALLGLPGVCPDYFLQTPLRRTFTYCKPLVVQTGKPPVELNRLDSKNWSPTPPAVQNDLAGIVLELCGRLDAVVLLSQVDVPETGVITQSLLRAIGSVARTHPRLLVLADSRTGLKGYPRVCLKMNRAEFGRMVEARPDLEPAELAQGVAALARQHGRSVFLTLAEQGLMAASPEGVVQHVPALPVRGPIDIVGAGDAVTANLAASLGAGAALREALTLANAAASVVIHQLGTTGTASVAQLAELVV